MCDFLLGVLQFNNLGQVIQKKEEVLPPVMVSSFVLGSFSNLRQSPVLSNQVLIDVSRTLT